MSGDAAKPRLAVVLFNLGGPDSLKAVEPFLFNLFNDPAIIPLPGLLRRVVARTIARRRREEASRNYAHMGGASPLLAETEAQARALEALLAHSLKGYEARVFTAMRYWRPFTQEAAERVQAFGPEHIVLLPLYPQYSTTTTGSSSAAWRKAYKGGGEVHSPCCYFQESGLVAAQVQNIRRTFDAAGRPEPVRLLFSAHGLPESVIKRGDPYQWQVERTCEAVVHELGDGWDWQVCYQSRVGPMKWIGPSTPEAIEAAGREGKGVLLVPIAFVSEHVETLVELDRDYRQLAEKVGCPVYLRAPTPSTHPSFIHGLARTVGGALRSAGVSPAGPACDPSWSRCAYRQYGVAAA